MLREGRVGDSVGEEEFVGMLTQMAFAGGETTSNLIANTVLALLTRPDQLAAVRAEPELAQGAVEETLRLDGPSKMSIRTAARDVDLDSRTLRAGDRIFLVTAAANRNPARFPTPAGSTSAARAPPTSASASAPTSASAPPWPGWWPWPSYGRSCATTPV
ncbi:hypothetical protein SHIRM173S_06186 [Streptomyces hirsutus]